MIVLSPNSLLTTVFVWCCDHLPVTVTRDYSSKVDGGERRKGIYYVQNGTTLCHVFWAILWVPLLITALISFLMFIFIAAHIGIHERNEDSWGFAGYFIPEIFMMGFALALVVAIFIGDRVYKIEFFKLLYVYLKGIKSKVCPLVTFE